MILQNLQDLLREESKRESNTENTQDTNNSNNSNNNNKKENDNILISKEEEQKIQEQKLKEVK